MKILIVDDNPYVLALMQKSLEQHGEVEAYHDGADALLRAVDAPPDLIISDFRMKGLDGRQLVEKLRARPQTRKIPVILVATKSDIEEKLQSVADQVEDFIPKPFFVKDLVQRAKRTIDKIFLEKKQAEAAGSGVPGVIRGRLSEMGIMDLFQSLEMGAKSCCLTIGNAEGTENAQLFFVDGQIQHGVLGDLTGDAVVNKIVHWGDGTFEINFNAPRTTEHTTTTGTQGLLMDALRLLDEEGR